MGSNRGSCITDEIHRVQQTNILFYLVRQCATGLCSSPCSKVNIRTMLVSKLTVLTTCSCSVHVIAVKSWYTLESLRTYYVIKILVHIKVCDIFTNLFSATHHHRRHTATHSCRSYHTYTAIDRSLKSCLTAECKTDRIRNVCTCIFSILSTTDNNLLDIIKIIVSI